MHNPNISALILGIVQGITEFLPISSDGHLVIFNQTLLKDSGFGGPAIDVLGHFGTLCSIVVIFHRELWRLLQYALAGGWRRTKSAGARVAWWDDADGRLISTIVLATIPTVIIGLLLRKTVLGLLDGDRAIVATGIGLLITAAYLLLAQFVKRADPKPVLGAVSAVAVGIAQAFALFPGLSRSASTISVSMLTGLEREKAFDFSFLMAVPAIAGACIFESRHLDAATMPSPTASAILFFTSFAVGCVALTALRPIVRRGKIGWFAAYVIPLGLYCLLILE